MACRFGMQFKAVIFDVDGTLADTEQYGHLPACNEAFRLMGLPIQWNWPYFKELMKTVQGNANRLCNELKKNFDFTEEQTKSIAREFTLLKKQLYINKYLPGLALRQGVLEFVNYLRNAGIRMAIVSTSYEDQINALLKNQLIEHGSYFNPVLGKESGQKTGEDGILYSRCLEQLGLPSDQCLVIEDSEVGLKAALKAGIPTIITYNDYTEGEDFTGATWVVSSLAELNFQHVMNGEFQRNITD